jgi:5-methylcytosine-specific restriction enzyme subunit McrC
VNLDTGTSVPMRPDLEFRNGGVPVLVGDVKYKLTGDALGRNPDYYQLLAYATALGLADGLLIYCQADSGRPQRTVTVRRAGIRLHTYALDLTGSPGDIDSATRELAAWVLDLSSGGSGFAAGRWR